MKNAPYRRILGIGFLTFVCNTGLTFTLPVMMKNSFHLPTSKIGLLMLPGAACAALLDPGSEVGQIVSEAPVCLSYRKVSSSADLYYWGYPYICRHGSTLY